jgi:hypothetical protein
VKVLGYLLYGLGLLVFWGVQIGLGLYGIFYIIKTFMEGGIIAGLISIPIVGVIIAVVSIILHFIAIPYTALVALLLGKTEEKEREIKRKQAEKEYLEAERAKYQIEQVHNLEALKRSYIAQGLTEEEANRKVNEFKESLDERL